MFFGITASASAADKAAPRTTCQANSLLTKYSANYHAVKKLHGARTPGRNIRKWGLQNGKPSSCRQLAKSYRTLKSMRFVGSTKLAGSRPTIAPAGTQTLRAPAGSNLDSIAQCESGGDPTATNGPYRGKYQFDQQTWNSVGGSGDPAAAPEAEQDQRAAMLQAQRGNSPWPVCGR